MTPDWDAFYGVIRILEELEIGYMVVGSVAASYHGLNRATHDVDLVVALHLDDVPKLVAALEPDYYVDEEGAFSAARHADLFNAIHNEGAFKIDFWVLKPDEFSRVQFDRRLRVDADGVEINLATAEDTILAKFLWYRITPSERQLADVKTVIMVGRERLDWDYLRAWAAKLGVDDLLSKVIEEE